MIGLVLNLTLNLQLAAQTDELRELMETRRSLPCEAIPIRFVLDDPVCADKLLRAMNVSNVRVLPRGTRAQESG